MRVLFALIHLSMASLALGQQPAELPDSTYLHLTLDLPIVGTFEYDSTAQQRRVSFLQTVRDVEVTGCNLSLKIDVQRSSSGADPRSTRNFYSMFVAVPLDAIDTERLWFRAEIPQGKARLEPQPWLIHTEVTRNAKSQILVRPIHAGYERRVRTVNLRMKDQEAAALLVGWLRDAANRCDNWNTAPLSPVR